MARWQSSSVRRYCNIMDYLNITRNNVTTDTIAELSLARPVLTTLQGNIIAIYLTAVGKLPFILTLK